MLFYIFESFGDMVPSGAVCSSRVAPQQQNTCMVMLVTQQSETTKFAWVIKECYISVLYLLVSHLCSLVYFRWFVQLLACCAATANTYMVS
jgi:hypothetical protein